MIQPVQLLVGNQKHLDMSGQVQVKSAEPSAQQQVPAFFFVVFFVGIRMAVPFW